MKLFAISLLCLVAIFSELAMAQNVTIEAGNTTSSANATSSADTSSANATSTANPTSSANTTTVGNVTPVSDGNQTVAVPANVTAPAGNSSASNTTESASNSTGVAPTNTAAGGGIINITPVTQSLNASTADMSMFGVSSTCADIVKSCYVEANTSALFEQYMFCGAYKLARSCVAENVTVGNDTQMCNAPDRTLLEVFSCGPDKLRLNVAPKCKARITQCATMVTTTPEKMTGVTDMLFQKKTCETLTAGGCLDVAKDGAVCSASELDTIKVGATCSGTAAILSSVLLLVIMAAVTKVM